jgi:hypothetical protein
LESCPHSSRTATKLMKFASDETKACVLVRLWRHRWQKQQLSRHPVMAQRSRHRGRGILQCVMCDPHIIPLGRVHRRCVRSRGVSQARAGREGLLTRLVKPRDGVA